MDTGLVNTRRKLEAVEGDQWDVRAHSRYIADKKEMTRLLALTLSMSELEELIKELMDALERRKQAEEVTDKFRGTATLK